MIEGRVKVKFRYLNMCGRYWVKKSKWNPDTWQLPSKNLALFLRNVFWKLDREVTGTTMQLFFRLPTASGKVIPKKWPLVDRRVMVHWKWISSGSILPHGQLVYHRSLLDFCLKGECVLFFFCLFLILIFLASTSLINISPTWPILCLYKLSAPPTISQMAALTNCSFE